MDQSSGIVSMFGSGNFSAVFPGKCTFGEGTDSSSVIYAFAFRREESDLSDPRREIHIVKDSDREYCSRHRNVLSYCDLYENIVLRKIEFLFVYLVGPETCRACISYS